jgi:hypothetical protein
MTRAGLRSIVTALSRATRENGMSKVRIMSMVKIEDQEPEPVNCKTTKNSWHTSDSAFR